MAIFLIVILVLAVLAMSGRTGHPGLEAFKGWNYAHRGLYNAQRPENSLAAFQAALEHGYGVELDVHLLRDGNLAVMHDSDLSRMTGRPGRLEDLTTQQLSDYHLLDSDQTIPEFRRVLELFAGKAPLIIELKVSGNNFASLCETACKMMEGYPGPWCMESFDPRCVLWLRRHRPDIVRGQLTENYFRSSVAVPGILKWIMRHQLANFITRPDFVAYRFRDRKTVSDWIVRKFWHIQGVTWTVQTPQEHQTALKEGWIPIFEHFEP